jgi:hypothetical protein
MKAAGNRYTRDFFRQKKAFQRTSNFTDVSTTTKSAPAFVRDLIQPNAPKARSTLEAWGKKRHFYKPLPKEFRRDGFRYRQIAREGNAAIYEQTWTGCSNPSISYEVIRIRRREGFRIGGKFVEPGEVYPKSEAWGVDGFTLTGRDAAFAKLQEMESK